MQSYIEIQQYTAVLLLMMGTDMFLGTVSGHSTV